MNKVHILASLILTLASSGCVHQRISSTDADRDEVRKLKTAITKAEKLWQVVSERGYEPVTPEDCGAFQYLDGHGLIYAIERGAPHGYVDSEVYAFQQWLDRCPVVPMGTFTRSDDEPVTLEWLTRMRKFGWENEASQIWRRDFLPTAYEAATNIHNNGDTCSMAEELFRMAASSADMPIKEELLSKRTGACYLTAAQACWGALDAAIRTGQRLTVPEETQDTLLEQERLSLSQILECYGYYSQKLPPSILFDRNGRPQEP